MRLDILLLVTSSLDLLYFYQNDSRCQNDSPESILLGSSYSTKPRKVPYRLNLVHCMS